MSASTDSNSAVSRDKLLSDRLSWCLANTPELMRRGGTGNLKITCVRTSRNKCNFQEKNKWNIGIYNKGTQNINDRS